MKLFLFFILITLNAFGESCNVSGPSILELGLDPLEGNAVFIDPASSREINPTYFLANCNSNKKFLELRIAVLTDNIDNSSTSGASIKEWEPSNCSILGSKIENQPQSEKIDLYKEKRKFLAECLEVHVTDQGVGEIKFPENQKFCKIEKISSREVKVNGLDCYFTNQPNSSFKVNFQVKEQCKEKPYFDELKIDLQEFISSIAFFQTNDSNGAGDGFEILSSYYMKVRINPSSEFFPITDSDGAGSRPLQWIPPDLNLGKILIQKSSGRTEIFVPFIVDNRCKETCVNGVCSSPCHFPTPVAGEVSLFKLIGNKEELVTSWYNGGVASANWQGIIAGLPSYIQGELEPGKYRLKVLFRDPYTDYQFLKKRKKSLFGNLSLGLNRVSGIGLFEGISGLSGIPEGKGFDSTIGSFSGLGSGKMNFSGMTFLTALNLDSIMSNWPPMYDSVCDKNLKNCQNPEKESYNAKLIAEFDLAEENNSSPINPVNDGSLFSNPTVPYKLKNVVYKRDSKYLAGFQEEIKEFPKVECKGPEPLPVPSITR